MSLKKQAEEISETLKSEGVNVFRTSMDIAPIEACYVDISGKMYVEDLRAVQQQHGVVVSAIKPVMEGVTRVWFTELTVEAKI